VQHEPCSRIRSGIRSITVASSVQLLLLWLARCMNLDLLPATEDELIAVARGRGLAARGLAAAPSKLQTVPRATTATAAIPNHGHLGLAATTPDYYNGS
jgi:hypothetical protein